MSHTILKVTGSSRNSAQPRTNGLLMTATLVPPPGVVARYNPQDRLDDYLGALSYYLALPACAIDRILFVDNSGGDISPLAERARAQPHDKIVEFISFSGNEEAAERGKAHGEFFLMDYGLAHATVFEPDDMIWKTTGRLKFLNLPEMIRGSEKLHCDILCDLHDVPWLGSGMWTRHENMDLRVFAFRRRAYEEIFREVWLKYVGNLDARDLYLHMRKKHGDYKIHPRFPMQAQLQGISGRHQTDYGGVAQRSKDAIRGGLRRVFPWLWF